MKCYNCGSKIQGTTNIECSTCHMTYPIKCKSCHHFNPKFSKHCANCGESLMNVNQTFTSFETLSESRKNVAVIFADISGFTALSEKMDPEELRDLINGCFDYITKPVYELEGTIDKYMGDCVMVLFGAKYSHADDVQRAVKCALKMQALIKEYSRECIHEKDFELKLSIGVNYGLVVTGRVGNAVDSDSTVMGDTVNTAQRLQTAAGAGNILVSESCYYETSDLVNYSDIKEISAKNKENPVKCYKALNLLQQNIKDLALISRADELDFIKTVYRNDFNNRFVQVIGEAGVGKTHLIDYFCEGLEPVIVRVSCNKVYKNRTYHTLSNLLLKIAKINEEESMMSKKNKLKTYMSYILETSSKEVLDKCYDFMTLITGMEVSVEFNTILNAMAYKDLMREIESQMNVFFENLYKRQNYIVVVDNMHWSDEGSIRILNHLVKKCTSKDFFYILSSYYPMEMLDNTCTLSPIGAVGIKELIQVDFVCESVDQQLLEQIMAFSNGNPLYVKEYINMVKRHKKYVIEEGKLTIDPEFSKAIPTNIENVILNNLSELDDSAKQFLYVASCVGKEFNVDWISKILKRSDYDEIIRKLIQLNIISLNEIYTTSAGLKRSYTFNQEIVKNVLNASMLNKQKKTYNLQIAELIERDHKNDLENYYDVLSDYFNLAGNAKKTMDYIYLAAIKNNNEFKLDHALILYQNFIESVKDDRRLVSCFMAIGNIYKTLGQAEKALKSLFEGLEHSKLSDEKHTIQLLIVELYKDTGRFDEALKIINEIEPTIRENSNTYGKLLLYKSNILYFKRDKKLLELAEKSEVILRKTRDYDGLGQLESILGMFYFMSGNSDDAIYYLNKSYENAEKSGNLKLKNKIGGNLGIVYHQTGNVSKALDYFTKTLETSELISDLKASITTGINLGLLYFEKGKFNNAKTLLEAAKDKSKEMSLIYQHCTALMNLGDVYFEIGDLDIAMKLYLEALEISKKHEMTAEEGILYTCLAKVKIKENKVLEAEKVLESSYNILNDINEISDLIDVFINKSLIEIKRKNYMQALVYCENAISYAEESEDDFKKVKGLLLKGEIVYHLDQLDLSLDCLNQSIKLSNQLESEYQSAIGYYERGQLYKTLDELELSQNDFDKVTLLIKHIDPCAWLEKVAKELTNG